jgi:hypothetical protein
MGSTRKKRKQAIAIREEQRASESEAAQKALEEKKAEIREA